MNHSILAPSGMSITTPCPGSILLGMDIPDEDTEDTRVGEATHWVGEHMLRVFTGERSQPETYLGITAPNGVIVTEEMVDCATIYFDAIKPVIDGSTVYIEQQVEIPRVHELCFGTPDAVHWNQGSGILTVWDYKHGHSGVDAIDNYQLAAYASGFMSKFNIDDQHVRLSLNIVQPRCYDGKGEIRTWNGMGSDIRGLVNQMEAAAVEALSPAPSTHAGPHCRHCKARYRCETNQRAGGAMVDFAGGAVPQELSDAAMGYELEVLEFAEDILKHRKKSLEAEALARALAGHAIPGRALEQGYGHDKWVHPVGDVIAMGDMFGVDLRAPEAAKTPAQSKAVLKKNNIDESVIKGYYGKQPSAMKLVKDDGSKARSVFNQENKS